MICSSSAEAFRDTGTASCGCAPRSATSGQGAATPRYDPQDHFQRLARAEGYRSRAAYKLIELLRRMAPLRPGDAVVDLGCAPGGWLQVLAERVGGRGLVLGVETRPVEPLGGCVRLLELDFTSPAAPQRIAEELGREATAVFCDAAPRLSGIRDVDRAALEEIHAAALAVCERVLRPGGRLVLKGFPGPASEGVRQELRRRFERVTEVRPQATRRGSREFYWVATGTPRRLSPRRRTRRGTRA